MLIEIVLFLHLEIQIVTYIKIRFKNQRRYTFHRDCSSNFFDQPRVDERSRSYMQCRVYEMPKLFPLRLWKSIPVPGSPDAAKTVAQKWSSISSFERGCTSTSRCQRCVYRNMSARTDQYLLALREQFHASVFTDWVNPTAVSAFANFPCFSIFFFFFLFVNNELNSIGNNPR